MFIDFSKKIPGAHNFRWGEFFVTSHDQERLRKEFLALPLVEQMSILLNIQALAVRLQIIRDTHKFPIKIICGWRSRRVEALVGGKGKRHPKGGAADLGMSAERNKIVYQELEKDPVCGLGKNDDYTKVHVDVLGGRWKYD